MVAQVVDAEVDAGEGEGDAEAGVENGNEDIRHQMCVADGNPSCHHHCHDHEGLSVKEAPKGLAFIHKLMNTSGVFANQFREHAPEEGEHHHRFQCMNQAAIAAVCHHTDAGNVEAGCKPYQARQ